MTGTEDAVVTRSIIDAHAHVWNRDRTPIDWIDDTLPEIDRDFSVTELELVGREAAAEHGVRIAGFVLVQALNDSGETDDLLRTAPDAVVGWVDLSAAQVAATLDRLREERAGAGTGTGGGTGGTAGTGRLAGIRHLAHVDPDPEWLLRAEVSRGLAVLAKAGLAFDLVVRPWQLETAAGAADAQPELRFVLDHLGQPPLAVADADPDALDRWEHDLHALARRPNVVAKISGVAARGVGADDVRLRRIRDAALDAFGPSRLMFGSDWPLVRLADGYGAWLGQYLALTSALSPDEQRAIDETTARDSYGVRA